MTNELKQFLLEEGFTEQDFDLRKDVNWYEFTDLMEKLINANGKTKKNLVTDEDLASVRLSADQMSDKDLSIRQTELLNEREAIDYSLNKIENEQCYRKYPETRPKHSV